MSVADVNVDDDDIDILSAADLNVASVIPPAAEEEPALTDEEEFDEDISDEDAVDDGEKTDEDSADSESAEDKPEESN